MYVCMYVCMYIYIHIYTYIYLYISEDFMYVAFFFQKIISGIINTNLTKHFFLLILTLAIEKNLVKFIYL